jgi:hypothetical protein
MNDTTEDDDCRDGCDIDFTQEEQLDDEELELFSLFADALDPNTGKTVEEAKAEWEELFNASTESG